MSLYSPSLGSLQVSHVQTVHRSRCVCVCVCVCVRARACGAMAHRQSTLTRQDFNASLLDSRGHRDTLWLPEPHQSPVSPTSLLAVFLPHKGTLGKGFTITWSSSRKGEGRCKRVFSSVSSLSPLTHCQLALSGRIHDFFFHILQDLFFSFKITKLKVNLNVVNTDSQKNSWFLSYLTWCMFLN